MNHWVRPPPERGFSNLDYFPPFLHSVQRIAELQRAVKDLTETKATYLQLLSNSQSECASERHEKDYNLKKLEELIQFSTTLKREHHFLLLKFKEDQQKLLDLAKFEAETVEEEEDAERKSPGDTIGGEGGEPPQEEAQRDARSQERRMPDPKMLGSQVWFGVFLAQ